MAEPSEPVNVVIPFHNCDLFIALISYNQEEHDPHFEPVLKLTEQVETKTHEEDEEAIFKMYVSLFKSTSIPFIDIAYRAQARQVVPIRDCNN